jgi:hypothetical protein
MMPKRGIILRFYPRQAERHRSPDFAALNPG